MRRRGAPGKARQHKYWAMMKYQFGDGEFSGESIAFVVSALHSNSAQFHLVFAGKPSNCA